MPKKHRSFNRKPTREGRHRLHSPPDTQHHVQKNPPDSRFSHHRTSYRNQLFRDFISNPLGSFSNPTDRLWYGGILALTVVGAIFGFYFLPDGVFGLNGLRVGVAVFFVLGALLKVVVHELRTTYYSCRSLLWWGILLLTATFGGAILGFFLLPEALLIPSRIFLGACFGCIGLLLPTVLIRVFIIFWSLD
jgi:hypothetical protein